MTSTLSRLAASPPKLTPVPPEGGRLSSAKLFARAGQVARRGWSYTFSAGRRPAALVAGSSPEPFIE